MRVKLTTIELQENLGGRKYLLESSSCMDCWNKVTGGGRHDFVLIEDVQLLLRTLPQVSFHRCQTVVFSCDVDIVGPDANTWFSSLQVCDADDDDGTAAAVGILAQCIWRAGDVEP